MIFTSILIAAMISNCEDTTQIADITSIEYGTSFGSCLGYCHQKVVFAENEISKTLTPTRTKELETKTCSRAWNGFQELIANIDYQAFSILDDVIGCPDCADGGAEWIEITTQQGSKKVQYEYGKEPKAVKSFIADLREYYDELGECE